MVLKIKVPQALSTNHWIERIFVDRYKLKSYQVHRYISLQKAAAMLGKSEYQTFNFLVHSKTVHAFEVWGTGVIHIHPESFVKYLGLQLRKKLKKEINSFNRKDS